MQHLHHRAFALTWLACLLGCPGPALPGTDEVESTTAIEGESSDDSATTLALDGEPSESESSEGTASESDTGDERGIPHPPGESPACTIMPGDHSSICVEGDPCPIVDDVEIECEGYGLGSDGTGIVIDAERIHVLGMSNEGGWLFTVQGDSAEVVSLPDAIDDADMRMAGDQESGLHMLATTTWSGREHIYVVPEGDGYLLETISATPEDDYTRPFSIAVDSLDRPHIWVRQQPGVVHGIREDDWTLGPSGSISFNEYDLGLDRLDRQVELVRLVAPPMVQLATRIEGVDRPLGDPIEGDDVRAFLAQPIRPSAADPGNVEYALVYQPWLVHAIWPVGEASWQEVVITEAIPNLNPCPSVCPCPQQCIDDVGGVDRLQMAQVVDDELWLAWTTTVDNTIYFMGDQMIGDDCTCWVEGWGGQPTSSFHLTRIDTTDGSYENVLELALPNQILRLDIHAWERRLGVRLYIKENGIRTVRALGIDLDGF